MGKGQGGRAKVAKEGRCRMCLRPDHVRQLTRHHLLPRRRSGRVTFQINHPLNIVPLCRECHDLVETEESARKMLRRVLLVEEVEFLRRHVGARWLAQHYPWPEEDEKLTLADLEKMALERPVRVDKGGGNGRKRRHKRKVHIEGCDPYWGCKAGCPVAVEAGTYYPMI